VVLFGLLIRCAGFVSDWLCLANECFWLLTPSYYIKYATTVVELPQYYTGFISRKIGGESSIIISIELYELYSPIVLL